MEAKGHRQQGRLLSWETGQGQGPDLSSRCRLLSLRHSRVSSTLLPGSAANP